jgi:hypothetical protein
LFKVEKHRKNWLVSAYQKNNPMGYFRLSRKGYFFSAIFFILVKKTKKNSFGLLIGAPGASLSGGQKA